MSATVVPAVVSRRARRREALRCVMAGGASPRVARQTLRRDGGRALAEELPHLVQALVLRGKEQVAIVWLRAGARALRADDSSRGRYALVRTLRELALLWDHEGEVSRARRWLRRARRAIERARKAGPLDLRLRIEALSVRDWQLRLGDRAPAVRQAGARRMVAAWTRLCARRPGSAMLRHRLASALLGAADLAVEQRLFGEARRSLHEAGLLLLGLADRGHRGARLRRLLALRCLTEGRLHLRLEETEEARARASAALAHLGGLPATARHEALRGSAADLLGSLDDRARDWVASERRYLESAAAFARVREARPKCLKARVDHAEALLEAGASAAMSDRRATAYSHLAQALEATPPGVAHARVRARALWLLARVSNGAEGRQLLREALGAHATAVLGEDLSPLTLADVLVALAEEADDEDGRALRVGACALADEVCAGAPDDRAPHEDLVGHARELARGARTLEHHAEAGRWLERAAERFEALAGRAVKAGHDPHWCRLDDALENLAWHHLDQHRPAEAIEVRLRGLGWIRDAQARQGRALESLLAGVLFDASRLCRRAMGPREGARLLCEAHRLIWRAHRAAPDDLSIVLPLGRVLRERAALAHDDGRHALATALAKDTIAVLERFHALLPDHAELRCELVRAHHERFRQACDPDVERALARTIADLLAPLHMRGELDQELEEIWAQAQGYLRSHTRRAIAAS